MHGATMRLCSVFIGGISRKNNRLFFLLTPPINMEIKQCSETSAHKIHTPEHHPKERIQCSEHGENLNSRVLVR